ncbi:MAG TPA: LLM class flavin-dependent oxidoreductase [Xanthobacteraceae bacterium]|jgi:alkanesulfonate monooxygenase SsuD/methylene tetrahydromethanopterin reductase-like flavin-dependent oxidoreductase (luciferase family)|nr:LLM class flavin-dependent oxidoreductase [Xanthobacteraceae bacterium]
MKFYMIHLMPFADLDLSYDKHYNSAWVTLPNSYYDPQKGAKLYNRYIDELVLADELGFDGVCCNEHHQNAYGLMPIPGVIAGALVRETKRCQVAVLGRALPLLTYPLSVAEEYAMLDNISNGRLIAGFVRGIGAEYHSTGVNPAESHDRFHEAHDLILQAWSRPGPFAFEGKYYHFQYVNTWPRPVQQPHPPVWIPSQGSRETIEWASHPSRRYTYLQTFSPVDQLARFMAMYQQQAQKYGYQASPQQLGWATPVYVSDSDESALREARPHIEAFYNKFLRMPVEMLLPPGYLSLTSMAAVTDKIRSGPAAGGYTIEDLSAKGMIICGGPDSVVRQLETYQKQVGFGKLIAMTQFGTLPHDLTVKSMELFAREVMPRLRHIGEEQPPVRVHAAE